jgi:hypothetical protein
MGRYVTESNAAVAAMQASLNWVLAVCQLASVALTSPWLGPPAPDDARDADLWIAATGGLEPGWSSSRRVRRVRVLDRSFDEGAPRYDGVEIYRDEEGGGANGSTIAIFTDFTYGNARYVEADCKVAIRFEPEAVSAAIREFGDAHLTMLNPQYRAYFDVVLTHSPAVLAQAATDGVSTVVPFTLGKCELPVCAPVDGPPAGAPPAHARVSLVLSGKRLVEGHRLRHEAYAQLGAHLHACGSGVDGRRISAAERAACLGGSTHSVVIENAREGVFFTEKLVDAMLSRTVPIYWGSAHVPAIFDPRGLIVFDDLDELRALLAAGGALSTAPRLRADYEARREALERNARVATHFAREPFARALALLVSPSGALSSLCERQPRASLRADARAVLADAARLPDGLVDWAARVVRSGCAHTPLRHALLDHAAEAERLRSSGWPSLHVAGARPPRSRAAAERLALAAAALAGQPLRRALDNRCVAGRDRRRLRWLALALALAGLGELPRPAAWARGATANATARRRGSGKAGGKAGGVAVAGNRAEARADDDWLGLARHWARQHQPAQPREGRARADGAPRLIDGGAREADSGRTRATEGTAPPALLVFIAVISAPRNELRRQRVREAWLRADGGAAGSAPILAACTLAPGGSPPPLAPSGAPAPVASGCFFLGATDSSGAPLALSPTDATASDVVQLEGVADGAGAYTQLPRKVLGAMRWACAHRPAAYWLKLDDDVFAHVPALVGALRARPPDERRAYLGAPRVSLVDRNLRSSAYVPTRAYAHTHWPAFNQGIHYALSHDLVRALADGDACGLLRAPGGCAGEDVSLALWLRELGVAPERVPWMHYVHAGREIDSDVAEAEVALGCACGGERGAQGPAVLGLDSPSEDALWAELARLRASLADGLCACDRLPPRFLANEGRRLAYAPERDAARAHGLFVRAQRMCADDPAGARAEQLGGARCDAQFLNEVAHAARVLDHESRSHRNS